MFIFKSRKTIHATWLLCCTGKNTGKRELFYAILDLLYHKNCNISAVFVIMFSAAFVKIEELIKKKEIVIIIITKLSNHNKFNIFHIFSCFSKGKKIEFIKKGDWYIIIINLSNHYRFNIFHNFICFCKINLELIIKEIVVILTTNFANIKNSIYFINIFSWLCEKKKNSYYYYLIKISYVYSHNFIDKFPNNFFRITLMWCIYLKWTEFVR